MAKKKKPESPKVLENPTPLPLDLPVKKKTSGLAVFFILIVILFASVFYFVFSGSFSSLGQKDHAFSLSDPSIHASLMPSQSADAALSITNNGETDTQYSVESKSPLVVIAEKSFSMQPGQSKIVPMRINQGQGSDFIIENIFVSDGKTKQVIPIVITPIPAQPLLSLNLNPKIVESQRTPGSSENVELLIVPNTPIDAQNMVLDYAIYSKDAKVVFKKQEQRAMQTSPFFITLDLPRKPGWYFVGAKASVGDTFAASGYELTIAPSQSSLLSSIATCKTTPWCLPAILVILLLLAVLLFLLLSKPSGSGIHKDMSEEQFEDHLRTVEEPKAKEEYQKQTKIGDPKKDHMVQGLQKKLVLAKSLFASGKVHKAERVYDEIMHAYLDLSYDQKNAIFLDINNFYAELSKEIHNHRIKEQQESHEELRQFHEKGKKLQEEEKQKVAKEKARSQEEDTVEIDDMMQDMASEKKTPQKNKKQGQVEKKEPGKGEFDDFDNDEQLTSELETLEKQIEDKEKEEIEKPKKGLWPFSSKTTAMPQPMSKTEPIEKQLPKKEETKKEKKQKREKGDQKEKEVPIITETIIQEKKKTSGFLSAFFAKKELKSKEEPIEADQDFQEIKEETSKPKKEASNASKNYFDLLEKEINTDSDKIEEPIVTKEKAKKEERKTKKQIAQEKKAFAELARVEKTKEKQEPAAESIDQIREGKSKKFILCHKALLESQEFFAKTGKKKAEDAYRRSWDLYLDLDYEEKKVVYQDLKQLYEDLTKK